MPFWSSWFRKNRYSNLAPNKYQPPNQSEIEKIEAVRNDLVVNTCVRIVAHHLSRLEWSAEKKNELSTGDWELNWWKDYLKTYGKRTIAQLYKQAWAYNTGIAWTEYVDVGYFTYPKEFIVMPMRRVSDLGDKFFRYGSFTYDKNDCIIWRLDHPEEPAPALALYPFTDGLRILYSTEKRGRIIHALGIHWLEWTKEGKPDADDLEWRDKWEDQLGSGELIAGGHYAWKPSMIAGSTSSADNEITHCRDQILTKFGLQWLSAGNWTSGTKASVELQVKSYLDDLDGLADTLTADLQSFADILARKNGFERGSQIRFVHSTPTVPEPIAEYIGALGSMKAIVLTSEEKKIVYPKLGLPVPEETPDEVAVAQEAPKTAINEMQSKELDDTLFETRRQLCESGFISCIKNIQEGRPWRFSISGLQDISDSLGVTKEDLRRIVNSYKGAYEKAIKDLAQNPVDVDMQKETFNTIWSKMAEVIRKTTLKVRLDSATK